jgi:hypothetical protein
LVRAVLGPDAFGGSFSHRILAEPGEFSGRFFRNVYLHPRRFSPCAMLWGIESRIHSFLAFARSFLALPLPAQPARALSKYLTPSVDLFAAVM